MQFELNSAVIKPESFPLLNEVAEVIKKNPQIKKLAVEGHASADGDAKLNEKLSDDRAKSVRQYLIDKGGIKGEMLTAKGYGELKPIADNKTPEGKEKNRRVEFTILDGGNIAAAAAAPPPPATPATPAVAKPTLKKKVTK
ncbi:MAG: OmpA family protein [Myxococcales bacterium]|nr:OmpA family protein [Myxococcales bacterium]